MSPCPRLLAALPVLLGVALLVQGCQNDAPPPPPPPAVADLTNAGIDALRRRDWSTAVAKLVPAANQGDTRAQVTLGILYFTGLGVQRDFADAAHWFTPAAEKGDPVAEYNLGLLNDLGGTGVLQDHAAAVRYYQLAAQQGHAEAQYRLGLLYEDGRGVPQDFARALALFRQAGAGGYAPAMTATGVLYAQGRGVAQDDRSTAPRTPAIPTRWSVSATPIIRGWGCRRTTRGRVNGFSAPRRRATRWRHGGCPCRRQASRAARTVADQNKYPVPWRTR